MEDVKVHKREYGKFTVTAKVDEVTLERLENYFERNPGQKKMVFYGDAIREKLDREQG